MDGFEEFAYTPVEEEKNGRDSASKLPFSHVSLFFQFCFVVSSDQSVFITIA